MIRFAMIKPNGCVDCFGVSRHPPDGHVVLPEEVTAEYQGWIRYVDGLWEARPLLPAWERTATGISIPDCPEGVLFEVYDVDSGALLGRVVGDDVDLPDAGQYRIDVTPPEPWAPYDSIFIEVV